MAISLVGSVLAAHDPSGVVIDLPTLQAGDVVYALGYCPLETPAVVTGGYTRIATGPSNLTGVWRKVMGVTPDTLLQMSVGGGSRLAVIVVCLRGVNQTTPEDATATTANDTSQTPDPPAITVATAGSWVLACAGTTGENSVVSSYPAGYSNNTAAIEYEFEANNALAMLATKLIASPGSENPGSFGISNAASWAGITVAVRRALTVYNFTATSLTTASPAFGAPALVQKSAFTATALASSSPVIGTPAFLQRYTLTASALTTASPAFGTPAIAKAFIALDLVTASPVLGEALAVGQGQPFTALPLATSSPVFGTPELFVAVAGDLVTSSPEFGTPVLGGTYVLVALNLVTLSPDIGKPGRLPSPPPSYPPDMDRHVRRSGEDYVAHFIDLLPHGQAWPRDPDTTLIKALTGLALYWGFVDGRAADLLERESDPRETIELLPDWERAWGLPDPCFVEATTIGQRQDMLVMKMTLLGGQSRHFFESIAAWLGYSIRIEEYSPFMCGISQVGDTSALSADGNYRWQIGPPEMRFYWTAHVINAALNWFRASKGQAGVDPHLRIGRAEDQHCLFRRWKPAHSELVYSYANLQRDDSMAGTP